MEAKAGRVGLLELSFLVTIVLLFPPVASAQAPSCAGCYPDGQPCTLTYGAAGAVRDSVTGQAVAGAAITVLDLATTSAEDGSYALSGARLEQCHLDYYWSLSATAEGYERYELALYATDTNPGFLEILLDPLPPATVFPVQGFVAEFPACAGRMRGVTVTLQPLGLSTQTTVGVDGGLFAFEAVPPGNYTLTVSPACNPFGCWRETPVVVTDEFVQTAVCMDGPAPAVPPTPTRTPTPHCLFPTPPLCPIGQEPDCITGECVVGCGCKPCEPCPHGQVYSGTLNRCDCVSVPPTPTSTPCPGPVLTPCPLGERPNFCAPELCNAGCGCEECPSCPAGWILAPHQNSCECVPDPEFVTPTPRPTSTPDPCPLRPTPCPLGQEPRPCDDPCGLHCGCDPCPPCGEGEVAAPRLNFCRCVDPTPTATPPRECVGDCDGNGAVTVAELVGMVRAALGGAVTACLSAYAGADARIEITEVMSAVHDALHGCAGAPTGIPSPGERGMCYESANCDPCDVYPCRPFSASRDFCCRYPGLEGIWEVE